MNGIADASTDEVGVTNGGVTFTVESDTAECFVPVVWADADNDDNIDLDADNEPTEDFGIGGATRKVSPATSCHATLGTRVPLPLPLPLPLRT